MKLQAGKS